MEFLTYIIKKLIILKVQTKPKCHSKILDVKILYISQRSGASWNVTKLRRFTISGRRFQRSTVFFRSDNIFTF
ncbi:hypothetical protein RCL_jg4706.t1 [Rhizophagus clarus]|uniref:Uncharacterized protein n=1 Tax=Rhizophagus clarus TaxID=94130 RepID=A0A8H3L9H8_9GLOM|nr:hypothetical protein RCL_jg4706.t1 [Rhizophagus clarus]